MNRRSLLLGLGSVLAAPAVVRADSLMKVVAPKLIVPMTEFNEARLIVEISRMSVANLNPTKIAEIVAEAVSFPFNRDSVGLPYDAWKRLGWPGTTDGSAMLGLMRGPR